MKNPPEKTLSLKKQSAWLLAAKLIGFGFSFVLPLLVVRFLSQDKVGLYRESFLVIMNAIMILPLGFSMSAYYFLSREPERRGAAILNILIFNFVVGGIACLALVFYPQLIGNIFRSEELAGLAPKIGIVIWIWIFSTFLETVAIANQEAKLATAFIIFAQFSKTLLMGSAVFLFGTVESFIYAAMIQGSLQTLILLIYLNLRFPGFWRGFDAKFFREQLAYAIPFGLAGILWVMQTDIHNYFVGYKFTAAEFAVYAYGCFEVPLIAMLAESLTSVMIPRMSSLQATDEKEEMIRITARAMQKLAFFYFPIYAFLIITAQTFITTLFTQDYAASVPVFMINLTLLPFSILITDPVVRAFKELGRLLLILRIFTVAALVSALYFGLQNFGLQGMIGIAVAAIVVERIIAETVIIRRLGVGRRHIPLLKSIGKTVVVSAVAGIATYFVYANAREYFQGVGENFAHDVLSMTKPNALNFIGGSIVMLVSAMVFVPIYLAGTSLWGVIETEEKQAIRRLLQKLRLVRRDDSIPDPQS